MNFELPPRGPWCYTLTCRDRASSRDIANKDSPAHGCAAVHTGLCAFRSARWHSREQSRTAWHREHTLLASSDAHPAFATHSAFSDSSFSSSRTTAYRPVRASNGTTRRARAQACPGRCARAWRRAAARAWPGSQARMTCAPCHGHTCASGEPLAATTGHRRGRYPE